MIQCDNCGATLKEKDEECPVCGVAIFGGMTEVFSLW